MKKLFIVMFIVFSFMLSTAPAMAGSHYPAGTVLPKAQMAKKADLTCHGSVAYTRKDTWGNEIYWRAPTETKTNHARAVLSPTYWHCPNKQYTSLVKILKYKVCINPVNNLGPFYDGAVSDPVFYDDDVVVPASKVDIEPNDKNQECTPFTIPVAKRKWMVMSLSPSYRNELKIKIAGYYDKFFDFTWGAGNGRNNTDKPINPNNDFVVEPLHHISD